MVRVLVLRRPVARLDDDVVGLRPFLPRDLGAFQAATRPGGNDGWWLSVDNDDPQRSPAGHIDSWSFDGEAGRDALAIVDSPSDVLIGATYIEVRAENSVELSYGVAPSWRGKGWQLGPPCWHQTGS